ncbi:unnamed protein product [Linum tenue]|uniref:Uncharacterized protein n=1 Tax=Linum tenue TaxID=586396 RepID=A0AAV0LU26_9ROSI|nr:unnamed protein product [Linum tenue]
MGPRNPRLRNSFLRQPILRLPSEPALRRLGLRPNRGAPTGEANGGNSAYQEIQNFPLFGLQMVDESGAVQHEGARPHHHLRQLRLERRLRGQHRHDHQGILQAGSQPGCRFPPGADYPIARLRMGRAVPEDPRRLALHVVAGEPGPGLAVSCAARNREEDERWLHQAPILHHRVHLQFCLLRISGLLHPFHFHRIRDLPDLDPVGYRAAGWVRFERAWRGEFRARLGYRG